MVRFTLMLMAFVSYVLAYPLMSSFTNTTEYVEYDGTTQTSLYNTLLCLYKSGFGDSVSVMSSDTGSLYLDLSQSELNMTNSTQFVGLCLNRFGRGISFSYGFEFSEEDSDLFHLGPISNVDRWINVEFGFGGVIAGSYFDEMRY